VNTQIITSVAVNLPATGGEVTRTATCPTGKVITGGGWKIAPASATALYSIRENYASAANAWTVTVRTFDAGTGTIQTYAICTA
jgi:hypothetical protein